MEKISAVVITHNEEKNIIRLINSFKDCDEVIINDDNSTDKTVEIAKYLGATVIIRKDNIYSPTEKDIADFKDKFGYLPKFTPDMKLRNFSMVRNNAMERAKNDWVLFVDADEIVSWDLKEIEKLQPICDQIECPLIQSRNADGTIASYNMIGKLFRKSRCKWVGRIHEVVMWDANISPVIVNDKPNIVLRYKRLTAKNMKIDHYQLEKDKSGTYPCLEYSLLKDNDPRSMFYLGREYYYYKEYDKAIKMFDMYIKVAPWLPEMSEAYYLKALCLWELHRGSEARESVLHSIEINANHKKALELMATMSWEKNAKVWREFAKIVTNEEVVFC
jgi:glycosyltransferase involved in cell wall biosynthesis